MAWLFALDAEILGSLDDADAEEKLPVAVHRHASRKRIFRADDPTRQRETIGRRVGGKRREGGGNAGINAIARLVVLPANMHERLTRLGRLFHHHHRRQGGLKIADRIGRVYRRHIQFAILAADRIAEMLANLLLLAGDATLGGNVHRRRHIRREKRTARQRQAEMPHRVLLILLRFVMETEVNGRSALVLNRIGQRKRRGNILLVRRVHDGPAGGRALGNRARR